MLISVACGMGGFAVTQIFPKAVPADLKTALPLAITCLVFLIGNYVNKARGIEPSRDVAEMLDYVSGDTTATADAHR